MARISFTPLVEEIVGKLAGSVFQDSYGGFQVRTRVTPRNPQTTYQQLRRGEFGFLSASWRNLTPTERASFSAAAPSPGAALNFFLTTNVNLTLIEEPIITTFADSAVPDEMPLTFLEASPEGILIRAVGAVTTVPANTKLLVYLTFLKQPSKIFTNPSQYSPVISFDAGTDLSASTDILAAFTARYGVMKADMLLGMKTRLISKVSGRSGPESITSTITEDMANNYIQLAAFKDAESNAGAGTEQLNQYAMPANTLSADLAKIVFEAYGSYGNFGNSKTLGFTIGGTSQNFLASTSIAQWKVRVVLQRYSNTEVNMSWEQYIDQVLVANQSTFFSGLNWSAITNLSLRTTNAGANDITSNFASFELFKAP